MPFMVSNSAAALAEGMAETAMTRPSDPVEFLGLWLAKYCDNIEAARVQKEIQQRYQAEEEQAIADAEAAKAAEVAEKSLQARDAAELEEMNGIISGEAETAKLRDSVLEFLKTKTGATAGYVGICGKVTETTPGAEEGDEPTVTEKDVLNYVAATSNNKFMVEKQLVKPPEGEGNENLPGTLTFSIFEKVEDIPEPTEEVPEPAPPEGGWPMKWKAPFLRVAECVREPRMKYFRTPKLGSYVALPFDFTYEVDTMNEGDGPDLVDGECPPFPEYTTATHELQGCVALDTLGTDGEFKDADCDTAAEWTAKLATGLARIEAEKIGAERDAREGFKARNGEQWTELQALRTAFTEELQGLLDASKEEAAAARAAKHAETAPAPAEGEEPPPVPEESEAESKLREGLVKLGKLKERVLASKEMLATLADRTDAPSRHWKVLQAALLFMLTPPDKCDTWEKCVQEVAVTDGGLAMFEAVDVSVAREVLMVQSGEGVQAAIEGIDIKNVERTHVPIALLMDWLVQALEVQAAAVEVRKAAKEAAEAAGEPYDTQVEDTVTDKPAEEAPPPEE